MENDAPYRDLQAPSNLFYELFRRTGDMIMIYRLLRNNQPGKIMMANAVLCEKLGYSESELKRKDPDELADPDTLRQPARDRQHPATLRFDRTLISKSGKRISAEARGHVFELGAEKYVFVILRDTSDRKEKIKTLRKSQEKFQRLVEKLSEEYIFYSHNSEGMITYISPSIEKVMGYTQNEALRDFREFLTDHEMNKEALKHSQGSLKGIVQPPFTNELYHRDGSTRVFYNTEIPVFNESGEVVEVEGLAYNITDRLKAEEELKKQEEYFRLLVETISEVFWIFDMKEDSLVYVNPQYEQVYGKSRESLYANPGSFLKLIHPEDRDRVKKAYRKIAKGTGINEEYRIITPDGQTKWISSQSFIISDEKKKPKLSIGKADDITERVNNQMERNMLAAIVENTEDHAVIKDTDLRVVAANKANIRAAGKKKMEELTGKTDIEIYGDHEHVWQYIEDDKKALTLRKGEVLVNEQVFMFPDKKTIQSLVKKFPVYNEKNQVIGVASISRDITDYKKALHDLSESEERYKTLIDLQEEGIGMLDQSFRFTFANPKAEEILETGRSKLIGESLFSFIDKADSKEVREVLKSLKPHEKKRTGCRLRARKGEQAELLLTASPLDKDGEIYGTFIMFKDVTQAKRAEDGIVASERTLKEANAAKDKFFSILAHDLKNPFHSIVGFSDLLLKHFDDYNKDELLTFIRMINEASRQTQDLLENLLHWSRAQTGKITVNPDGINLSQLIKETTDLLNSTAYEKNISLQNQVKDKMMIHADQNMMRTVFRNLISNAIKFTPPAGTVTITARTRKKSVEVTVEDNGVGIPEDKIDKLFRIDESFSTSGTANEEGTGLGLILVKEFLLKNGGDIEVKSKVDKGTKFILTIPAAASGSTAG